MEKVVILPCKLYVLLLARLWVSHTFITVFLSSQIHRIAKSQKLIPGKMLSLFKDNVCQVHVHVHRGLVY